MDKRELKRLDRELSAYLDSMTEGMGRPERRQAMRDYLTGLLLDGDRKSIEPMAGRLVDDESEIQAMRQRLQQCVTVSTWSDEDVWKRLALKGEAELPELEAWVVDDTGFPKKGTHSVGVQRQYSGTLGRKDNCQVAVSLHLASERGSLCMGVRLYVPESWTVDRERCKAVGVPDDVVFQTKWQLSLAQIDAALHWGMSPRVVLGDPGYGDVTEYRDGLVERRLDYVLGVMGTLVVWAPGTGPIAPPRTRPPGQRGLSPTRWKTGKDQPIPVLALAIARGRNTCRTVHWREGSRGRQGSRFGAVRIRTAHRHTQGDPPGDEQWLLYEWPTEEKEPTKFWFSTLPANTSLKQLVRLAKLRWRVERDYQEMKQEIGLDHFEGRGWMGFHHHATLCGVAHGFLALRRALSPPEHHEVDAARGEATAAADPAAAGRPLPPVPSPSGRKKPAARTVTDVIE
jgi:SRSO17 transposase